MKLLRLLVYATLVVATVRRHGAEAKRNASSSMVRGCYFTNWAQERTNGDAFHPDMYQPGLCTHILYAFVVFNSATFKAKSTKKADLPSKKGKFKKGLFRMVTGLKTKDKNLKVLLSFGGWDFGVQPWQKMVSTAKGRKTFIDSSIAMARKYDFDGVDIDWEYPQDKASSTQLYQELRDAIDTEAKSSGKPQLLLTAAVSASPFNVNGYDMRAMNKLMDLIFLMTYDYHGAWTYSVIGHNSPLYAQRSDQNKALSVAGGADLWRKGGVSKSKLIIGVGTYGRGWNVNSRKAVAGSAGNGGAKPVDPSYYEICDMIRKGGKEHWDNVSKVPFAITKDMRWYSYENPRSVKEKMKFIRKNGYGGAFVWALDKDDFTGKKCKKGKYPIISAIKQELGSGGGSGDDDGVDARPTVPVETTTKKPKRKATTKKPKRKAPTKKPKKKTKKKVQREE